MDNVNNLLNDINVNVSSNNNNNMNNSNNEDEEISNDITLNDFIWDNNNCGKHIKIFKNNPRKILSLQDGWSNSYVTGSYEFKKNTGIYNIKYKLTHLIDSYRTLVGIARLSDLTHSDEDALYNCYGWDSTGSLYQNIGSCESIKNEIPKKADSIIIYIKLDTNKAELETVFTNISGTDIYLTHTIYEIPFPCYPFTLTYYNKCATETIEFNKSK
eukprot:TRINITY_DN16416_c0_g1_i1.p1 TRINITY_DN16416_c0_g1~~TRINITY_DN16416_c0_g1_i1.p1  ORF type:complete len:215 (+),score=52.33 TRINITY_DN16416_c0_g1_i1:98-742(+)